jgi:hypothetical protein
LSLPLAQYTDFTVRALEQTRNPATLNWSVVVLIGLVSYIYTLEVQARRWPVIFAGIGFFLMDIFNETINAAVLHFSDHAAIWTTTGGTAYQPLVGLTVEIMFTFSIAGIAFVKAIPVDPKEKILGINNRLFFVTVFSLFSVAIELVLHAGGIFHWAYWWWNWPCIPLIVILGYMPFYGMAAWLYDMGDNTKKQLTVVGAIAAIDLTLLLAMGPILGWI